MVSMRVDETRHQAFDRAQHTARRVRETVKRAANRYIDLNEEIATRLFDAGRRMAERIEDSPVYPVVEFQQAFARKAFEYWLKGARLVVERL